jgi:hypothetical protein
MAKSLLEKANNQVWDALFREVMLYPSTTLRVMNELKTKKFISDLRLEDAHWIASEVLAKDYYRFGDFIDLFNKKQNQ